MDSLTADNFSGDQWLKVTLFCPLPLLDSASDLMGLLSGSGVELSPEDADGAFLSGFFHLQGRRDPLEQQEVVEQIVATLVLEMTHLFALYECTPGTPTVTLLADQDWATSWQQFSSLLKSSRAWLSNPLGRVSTGPGQHVLEMDPGMAFGTGQHASTRMASALIQQSLQEHTIEQVLDVGTGTGILAMAAALLGPARILAVDNDPDAVTVARENIARNLLNDRIEVAGTPVAAIAGPYQLVCANIVHDVLVEMAPDLTRLTAGGGRLVLAGILGGDQENNIVTVYRALGYTLVNQLHEEEWAALLLERKTPESERGYTLLPESGFPSSSGMKADRHAPESREERGSSRDKAERGNYLSVKMSFWDAEVSGSNDPKVLRPTKTSGWYM
jgi:ribosomal protein L11 methyltransferase